MNVSLLALVAVMTAASVTDAADLTVRDLLAHPNRFVGKRVSVVGFYHSANEESWLVATPDEPKRDDLSRCIWVDFHGIRDARPAVDHYVRFVGTFHYRPRARATEMTGYGQWNLFSAQLDVSSFSVLR